jgi:hypothetical protein
MTVLAPLPATIVEAVATLTAVTNERTSRVLSIGHLCSTRSALKAESHAKPKRGSTDFGLIRVVFRPFSPGV